MSGVHLHSRSTWEEVCKSALFSSSSVLFPEKIPSEILFRKESLSNTGNDSAFKVASTCPKSWEILKVQPGLLSCNPSFSHVIKLFLTQKLLSRVYVQNTPRFYPVHLSYIVKVQPGSTRTELYWDKDTEVLLGTKGATCEWCATVSQGAHRKAHGARVLPQYGLLHFQVICPLLIALNCAFHHLCWQGVPKDDLAGQEDFGKEHLHLSLLALAASELHPIAFCCHSPRMPVFAKFFCDRFSHSAPYCKCYCGPSLLVLSIKLHF